MFPSAEGAGRTRGPLHLLPPPRPRGRVHTSTLISQLLAVRPIASRSSIASRWTSDSANSVPRRISMHLTMSSPSWEASGSTARLATLAPHPPASTSPASLIPSGAGCSTKLITIAAASRTSVTGSTVGPGRSRGSARRHVAVFQSRR